MVVVVMMTKKYGDDDEYCSKATVKLRTLRPDLGQNVWRPSAGASLPSWWWCLQSWWPIILATTDDVYHVGDDVYYRRYGHGPLSWWRFSHFMMAAIISIVIDTIAVITSRKKLKYLCDEILCRPKFKQKWTWWMYPSSFRKLFDMIEVIIYKERKSISGK